MENVGSFEVVQLSWFLVDVLELTSQREVFFFFFFSKIMDDWSEL